MSTITRQADDFLIESTADYEFSLTIAQDAKTRADAIREFFSPTKKLRSTFTARSPRWKGSC